ncbi:MAG: inosine-5'-monophosphate dehydrogenase related protein [Candidatus Bathyarchaeota archaeon B26-1]|nr:MAG: inosine-5'-monophosphate dehydrogenase related protein [Candidatus Bathyarchaeota archaeon B26-1]
MRVIDILRRKAITLDEETTVSEAARMMRDKGEGCAIIMSGDSPVGMITERDITWKVVGEGLDPKAVKVKDIMSTPLVTVDPDTDLAEAAKIMGRHRVRRLAVVKENKIYGVVKAVDIARHLEEYVDDEIRKILRYAFFFPVYS